MAYPISDDERGGYPSRTHAPTPPQYRGLGHAGAMALGYELFYHNSCRKLESIV